VARPLTPLGAWSSNGGCSVSEGVCNGDVQAPSIPLPFTGARGNKSHVCESGGVVAPRPASSGERDVRRLRVADAFPTRFRCAFLRSSGAGPGEGPCHRRKVNAIGPEGRVYRSFAALRRLTMPSGGTSSATGHSLPGSCTKYRALLPEGSEVDRSADG
jgi:hypothetical protein